MLPADDFLLYQQLASIGKLYSLDIEFDWGQLSEQIFSLESFWVPYNRSKSGYKREGLSLTSLNGERDGEIDLNSILEYNKAHGTNLNEMSFRKTTENWKTLSNLSEPLHEIEPHLGRSHLLRFGAGGFFPPHRDTGTSYRLIAFTQCCHESFYLILDGERVRFKTETLYFMDTRLEHSLFSFQEGALCLVLNVALNKDSVSWVFSHLNSK